MLRQNPIRSAERAAERAAGKTQPEGALRVAAPAQGLLLASSLAAATAAGAQCAFYLPWNPHVPVTLQTHFVVLAGLLLGPRWGAVSQAEYLLAGALGAPVFSGLRGGPAALVGPTAGYLLAFALAAWVTGRAAGRAPGFGRALAGALLGVLVCYAFGVAWLFVGWRAGADWQRSLWWSVSMGALPFLGVDLLKAGAAALIAASLRRTRLA